jgi:predicted transcriptional regulator
MRRSGLLLSLRPKWSRLILGGSKDVELRRQVPRRVDAGDRVLIYESSPTKAIVAVGRVAGCRPMSAAEIWRSYSRRTGMNSRDQVREYFEGAPAPGCIVLEGIHAVPWVSLPKLRQIWPEWTPPQSFGYLPPAHLDALDQAVGKALDEGRLP